MTIIGNGTVGKALAKAMGIEALGKSNDLISDDYVIICVPTETNGYEHIQKEVIQALMRIEKAKLVIIRSTILPGSTDKFQKEYPFPIMFVPEFGFEKTMEDDLKNPTHYLLGVTDRSICFVEEVSNLLPGAKEYLTMTAKAAEWAKYITNVWGCFQVTLANVFYDLMNGDDNLYLEATRGATKHKNIPKWGWKIWQDGERGYSGKCLPKDIKAIIGRYNNIILEMIDNYNENIKKDNKNK